MTVKRWLGNAAATFDVWTITLSGTVISQTYTITINGKTVTYTATGGDTTTTIPIALVAAWVSLTLPAPAEFQELTPVAAVGSIVITGKVAGRPSTISVGTSGAATFTIAHTTSATGPNDFTNAQNWSGGVAPANSDMLVFDNGSAPCKYNLNSSLTGVTVLVNPGFSGTIGLPFINADATTTYAEYRTTSLTLAGGTATINGPNCKRCNLAFGANATTVRVLATGQRIDQYTPVVLIIGGNGSSELDISKGDVGTAFYAGTTANVPTIKTGFVSNPQSDVSLICGTGTTLGTIVQNGGNVTFQSAVTTATIGVAGGTLTIQDGSATTINADAGTVILNSTGTIATLNMYNTATLDCDQDPRAKTITNAIYVGSSSCLIKDNQKSINSGVVTTAPAGLTTVNVQHGANTSIVYT